MHHSRAQLHRAGRAPENLTLFLEGQTPQKACTDDQEPPRKRQKTSGCSTIEKLASPDDTLTLARVDLSITFAKSPSESYPSPSSEEDESLFPVILEHVEAIDDGKYHFRITSLDGQTIFDDKIEGNISPESFQVLEKAIALRRSRSKAYARNSFTLSKSSSFDRDAETLGYEHDASLTPLELCARILIPNSRSAQGISGLPRRSELWSLFPSEVSNGDEEKWSPREFYDNVHVPVKESSSDIPPTDKLQCTLYPFQRRAVKWLLQREGVFDFQNEDSQQQILPQGFNATCDADGSQCFVNSFLGIATTDINFSQRLSGGILAEEMGLGKTVEIMALICLHQQPEFLVQENTPPPAYLPHTPATLIITPPSILQQWKSELETLAPSLKVLIYDGLRVEATHYDHEELINRFTHQDVVLTTYNVLGKEIHYAESTERALRHEKKYEKRLSPLTRMLWWRIVLDEAQMVESGVSNAAKVANLIPRQMAWCVSGTPVRKDARDLFGLLVFLRYQPYCNMPQLWDRLITHHRSLFRQIFKDLALRHTKEQIMDEIQLPSQKRVVITVPFTAIEEQHYSSLFQQMADDCGLDAAGAPLHDDWSPEDPEIVEKMRTWLTRLRQTCLHPEVGSRNRRALGNGRGPLRTVAEVLEVMIDQNDTATRAEERTLLLSQIRRGQMLEHAEYSEEALQIWLATLEEAKVIVRDCRHQLKVEHDKISAEQSVSMLEDDTEDAASRRTGPHRQRLRAALEIEHTCIFFAANAYYQIKMKQMAKDEGLENIQQPEAENKTTAAATPRGTPSEPSGTQRSLPLENVRQTRKYRSSNLALESDLPEREQTETNKTTSREITMEEPQSFVLEENVQTDEKMSTNPISERAKELEQKEEAYYEMAKVLRRELLLEARKKAGASMAKICEKREQQSFASIPATVPMGDRGGIESRKILERIERLFAVMKDQTAQITAWREKATQLLTLPLVDNEDNDIVQGDEYESSTKQQDECYVYVDALRALVSDRHDILTGQNNLLIEHEMEIALAEAREGRGHAPRLLQQLLHIRRGLKVATDLGSVRGLITELRELKTTLRGAVEKPSSRAAAERAAAEHVIVNRALQRLHQISNEHNTAQASLDKEIETFKDTMNLRLEYYRQLQAISDTVAPYEENMSEEVRNTILSGKEEIEAQLKARIATLRSKGRYLIHLRDEAGDVETQRTCIICTASFENGLLTSCGHSYCTDCFRIWWGSHRNCPTCKKHLSKNDFHEITYKPKELTMQEEEAPSKEEQAALTEDTKDAAIYSGIREPILNQIKNVDLDGSFGTKIDTLARHMLWIREHDPGAKSIVFSQYKDFLDVLARAFAQFKIGSTGIDRKDGIQKFKNDPSMECFFLHAKAHSSGLNLVNATHVFLCEPLINTAIELQAIARVHRIGQHHDTTVWMYLVEGTVEKSIYDISVQRRLAHMGQVKTRAAGGKKGGSGKSKQARADPLESQIEAANTLELEQAPLSHLLTKGTGGELVRKDDLWNCLFRSRPGVGKPSQEAEREVARHLGAEAAQGRMKHRDGTSE